MRVLQKQPSLITLREEVRNLLIVHEQTDLRWLFRILGLWVAVILPLALLISPLSLIGAGIILAILLFAIAMTLASWSIAQTYTFDRTSGLLTTHQRGLLGPTITTVYALAEIREVQAIPKNPGHSQGYYISLTLASGKTLEIDLTSSEDVDQEITHAIRSFMQSVSNPSSSVEKV